MRNYVLCAETQTMWTEAAVWDPLCVRHTQLRVKESLCKLLTDSLWRNVHTCLFERIHSHQCWFSLLRRACSQREKTRLFGGILLGCGLSSPRHPSIQGFKTKAWRSHPPRIHIPARGHLSPDHRGTAVKPRGESISLKPAHPNPQNIQQGMMGPPNVFFCFKSSNIYFAHRSYPEASLSGCVIGLYGT